MVTEIPDLVPDLENLPQDTNAAEEKGFFQAAFDRLTGMSDEHRQRFGAAYHEFSESNYAERVKANDGARWARKTYGDIERDTGPGSQEFFKAAANLYDLYKGEDNALREQIDRIKAGENPHDVLDSKSKHLLAGNVKWRMSWINNNVAAAGYSLTKILPNATPEQIASFTFLMDVHDNTSWTSFAVGRTVGMTLFDPLTYTLVGKASGKIGQAAAKTGLKALAGKIAKGIGADAAKDFLAKSAVKILPGAVTKQFAKNAIGSKVAGFGFATAVENTLTDPVYQALDVKIGHQEKWSNSRALLVAPGMGFAMGAGLGGLGLAVANPHQVAKVMSDGVHYMSGGFTSRKGLHTLPEYKPSIDLFKFWMHRNLNPLKLFTNWAPSTNMGMNSIPVIRPVVRTADGFLEKSGLIRHIQNLQDNVLNAVDNGANAAKVIDDFAANHGAELTKFQKRVQKLRQHVNDTYGIRDPKTGALMTVDEIPQTGARDSMPHAIWAFEHEFTGITRTQKKALLSHLDDLEKTIGELQKGSAGLEGQEILNAVQKIQRGEFSTQDFRDSITGIGHSSFLANNAETRLTKNWAGTNDKANVQWRLVLERSIQDGYYNPEHYSKPISLVNIKKENIERQWQNQILTFFKDIGDKDENGVVTNVPWSDINVPTFSGLLEQMYTAGLGHDAMYVVDDLARRRQKWKVDEVMTLPPEDMLATALKNSSLHEYGVDKRYTKWVDTLVQNVSEEHANALGAAKILSGGFQHNRPNEHFYAERSYPYRFSVRYPYTNLLATPGLNYWSNRLFLTPLKQTAAYFAGAKKITTDLDVNAIKAAADITWMGEDENWVHVIGRGFARTFSGATINHIKFGKIAGIPYAIPKPTKLGYAALGSVAVAGAGKLSGNETLETVGQIAATPTSYLMEGANYAARGIIGIPLWAGIATTSGIANFAGIPNGGFYGNNLRVDYLSNGVAKWMRGANTKPHSEEEKKEMTPEQLAEAAEAEQAALAGSGSPAPTTDFSDAAALDALASTETQTPDAATGNTNSGGQVMTDTPKQPTGTGNGKGAGITEGLIEHADRSIGDHFYNIGDWIAETLGLSDESKGLFNSASQIGYIASARGFKTAYEFGDWASQDKNGRNLLAFGAGAVAFMLTSPILNFTGLGKIPILGAVLKFGIGAMLALVAYAKVNDMLKDHDDETRAVIKKDVADMMKDKVGGINIGGEKRLDQAIKDLTVESVNKVTENAANARTLQDTLDSIDVNSAGATPADLQKEQIKSSFNELGRFLGKASNATFKTTSSVNTPGYNIDKIAGVEGLGRSVDLAISNAKEIMAAQQGNGFAPRHMVHLAANDRLREAVSHRGELRDLAATGAGRQAHMDVSYASPA